LYTKCQPEASLGGKDLGVHGRIILKLILEKEDVRMDTGFKLLRVGSNGGLL
jgi:hypothetical protein